MACRREESSSLAAESASQNQSWIGKSAGELWENCRMASERNMSLHSSMEEHVDFSQLWLKKIS